MSNHCQIPISDIKNHPHLSKNTKRPIPTTTSTSIQQTSSKVRKLENEIQQLRSALCEALDQNDLLRQRVVELQALLVQAQDQNDKIKERFLCDEKRLVRYWKNNQKYEMQLQKHNESADTSFYRSRSM